MLQINSLFLYSGGGSVDENPQRGAENTSPLPNPWGGSSSPATTTATSATSSTATTSATSTTSGSTPNLFRFVSLNFHLVDKMFDSLYQVIDESIIWLIDSLIGYLINGFVDYLIG